MKRGDIVQISMDCENKAFAGCLAVILEPSFKGAVLLCLIIHGEPMSHGQPMTAPAKDFHVVGAAKWIPAMHQVLDAPPN